MYFFNIMYITAALHRHAPYRMLQGISWADIPNSESDYVYVTTLRTTNMVLTGVLQVIFL